MASQIRYKFSEMKTWDTISFEGNTISVLDIKRSIILQKKLDKTAGDFDLMLKDAQSGEAFGMDAYLVNKNTSLIVRRIPASKNKSIRIMGAPSAEVVSVVSNSTPEDIAMAAIMNQSTAQTSRPVGGQVAMPSIQAVYGAQAENKPPANYICHKCNQGGHYIKYCPNVPVDGSDIKTFKQGSHFLALPRFFLKDVEKPVEINKNNFVQTAQDPFASSPQLICQFCKRPFKNAITTPCCYSTYCAECLSQNVSADINQSCPMCKVAPLHIDQCKPNVSLQAAVDRIMEQSNLSPSTYVPNRMVLPQEPIQAYNGVPPQMSAPTNRPLVVAPPQPVPIVAAPIPGLPPNYPMRFLPVLPPVVPQMQTQHYDIVEQNTGMKVQPLESFEDNNSYNNFNYNTQDVDMLGVTSDYINGENITEDNNNIKKSRSKEVTSIKNTKNGKSHSARRSKSPSRRSRSPVLLDKSPRRDRSPRRRSRSPRKHSLSRRDRSPRRRSRSPRRRSRSPRRSHSRDRRRRRSITPPRRSDHRREVVRVDRRDKKFKN